MILRDHPDAGAGHGHALLGDARDGTAASITLPDRLERITAIRMGTRVVVA